MIARRTALTLPMLALPAAAQSWPGGQTVSLIIPYAPGGASDVVGRVVQQSLGAALGGTFILENRAGASTTLAARLVKAARPDGQMLLVGTIATFSLAPLAFRNPGYDPLADFTHATQVCDTVTLLVANPRWQSLEQLLAAARARPGALSYASWGVGSTGHLPMVELLRLAGADMLHVPYNGSPQAMTDTMAGRTDCMLVLLAAGRAQIEAGRLRPLGISNPTRSDALPGLPTIAEQGFPGFGMAGWYSIQAPLGTPEPVLAAIRRAMATGLADGDVRRLMATNGLTPTPPDQQGEAPLKARIARELEQHRALLARAGVQPE